MDKESSKSLFSLQRCPNIYRINLESSSLNEVLSVFVDEILLGCCSSAAESVLVEYLTSIVEPIGWKAVWRSTRKSSIVDSELDFIVEVVNVSLQKLEADVLVKSVIGADLNQIQWIQQEVKKCSCVAVPLVELFVISEEDDDEVYLKTALAIEHVRFFLLHLQRPWDGEEDVKYTEDILKPRLQLYFDMKNNILPKPMISKIKMILKQATKVQREINLMYSEMNVSDSEAEINEEDFMRTIELKERLNELQTKMEMLENPVIRSYVKKKYTPGKLIKRRYNSGVQKPVTYIVAKQFTLDMIQNLSVDSNGILEFEHNPETAFKSSSAGDKIIIFPGTYICDTLGWVEEPITVQGVGGDCKEIVLEATGNSDVFLNCCTRIIEIENVLLRVKKDLLSAVVVHHGKLHMKGCIVDSNASDHGILLLGGAEAVLQDTIVCNSKKDGIQMKSLSSLHLQSSNIERNERYGLHVDAEGEYSTESFTELLISDSHITQNGSYGIFLNNVPMTDISLQRPSGDFTILNLFPWLRHAVEKSGIDNNGEKGIGVSSTCKSNVFKARPFQEELPKPEELNYSALSELLNAVNLSMERETQHLYN